MNVAPHEWLFAKNLRDAVDVITNARPDLVIYFAKGKDDHLEEQVFTWLIEGFHGKFLLFDPFNRVKNSALLLQSQVIDDYFSGPIGTERFVTIVKNRLSQDSHFAPPRAMAAFEMFRNLFERGLDAIFFFDEELERCLAANLPAEQMMGMSVRDLRKSSLRDLCMPEDYETAMRTIRRAGRHYYDSRGETVLKGPGGSRMKVSFSCGVFNFGRRNFVKLEMQKLNPLPLKAAPAQKKMRPERATTPSLHFHS